MNTCSNDLIFDEIIDDLNTLEVLSAVKQNRKLQDKIQLLKNKYHQNNFQIVILGQFKRGKTSLINALFGESILPVAVVPLTSVITIITYGEDERYTVRFLNGEERSIKKENLAEYITEPENPKNEKGVEQVIIHYPNEYLKKGIQIIDTPGVGSVYVHNTDTSYDFIPRADAGIFVVTADPPISESELQLLVHAKDYLARMIFVINKIDQVEETDRQQSLDFTRKIIEDAVGHDHLPFFQISAKLALDGHSQHDHQKIVQSGIESIKNYIENGFISKKEQFLILSVIQKIIPIINELELQLKIEEKAVQMSASELQQKIAAFKAVADQIAQEKEDSRLLINGQIEQLTNQILIKDIDFLYRRQLSDLLDNFECFFRDNSHLSNFHLQEKFELFLETSIKSIFSKWRELETIKLNNAVKKILDRFSSQVNSDIQKVVDFSANLFNLRLDKIHFDVDLSEEVEFKYSFGQDAIDVDPYTPIITRLPKFLSGKLLYNKMKDDVWKQFDRHCGRSRYDFHERIMKSLNEYMNQYNETLELTIRAIDRAFEQAFLSMNEIEENKQKTREQISQQLYTLAAIKIKLERYISIQKKPDVVLAMREQTDFDSKQMIFRY